MQELLDERNELLRWKQEVARIKVGVKYVKFLRAAIKAGFNPDQPRDEQGRWADGSGVAADNTPGDNGLSGEAYLLPAAGKQSAAYCWNQMQIDMLLCGSLQPASRRAICRGQANQRYGACIAGTQIPPLSY